MTPGGRRAQSKSDWVMVEMSSTKMSWKSIMRAAVRSAISECEMQPAMRTRSWIRPE